MPIDNFFTQASGDDGFASCEVSSGSPPWPPLANGGTRSVTINAGTDFGCMVRKYRSTFEEGSVGLIRFDTSAIPVGATILTADLVLHCTNKGSNGRDIHISWYDANNWPISIEDYEESNTPVADAAVVPIASFIAGSLTAFGLSNPQNVVAGGYTAFRMAVNGGDPAGTDYRIHIAEWDHPTAPAPRLEVSWELNAQQLRPDADLATAGWSTAPLWSKIDEDTPDGVTITGVAS